MKLRPLGKTGLQVTPIGMGLAALGRPGYVNLGHAEDLARNYDIAAMENRTHQVLTAAWQAGIRYFDAARSYGKGEAFLSSWIEAGNFSKNTITVGSKWGYTYTADWQVEAEAHEIKEHSLPVLQRQWKESQMLLGSHLDLYQIHSATFESGVLENHAVLSELVHLKSEGVCIGLSLSGFNQGDVLRKAMETEVDGHQVFDVVQATWNLLEQSAGPALQEASEAGWGVIIKEALANGRLTTRNDHADFADQMESLRREADQLNTTIDALALAGVLHQPWVDVVLSGAATIEHLHSNIQALHITWTPQLTEALKHIIEPPDQYWRRRKSLDWN